jgi:small subunit ribosomal protein S8
MARKENLDVPASKITASIFEILKKENYIDNYKLIEDKKQGILRIYLKYNGKKSAIKKIRRISKPSLRVYAEKERIPTVLRGKGIAILSTNKGILTDKEAREQGVGGEVLAFIW